MTSTRARRWLVAGLVVALIVAGALGARALLRDEPVRFTAMFDSTVGLYEGSDVQVLGVPVGKVTEVSAEGEVVRVSMELDPDQAVAADTKAVIVAPTMVSDRFVQLTEPWQEESGEDRLASGAVIEKDRTAVPVEIDDLYDGLKDVSEALGPRGANRNGALSKLLEVGADNLEGQGEGLNTMIREFGVASATLADLDESFFGTMANLDEVNKMLVENDDTVAEVNDQFADVAGFLAEDREEMGKAAENLADAMAVLDDFIRENRANLQTSVENLVPTTKALQRQRDSLEEMIRLAPLLLHNLREAYDPEYNLIAGRGNVNEVSVWSNDGLSARSSKTAPPTMLDGGSTDRSER
ncbi:MAG TPA: MCE family protein [Nocardioides sp.]|uniref:MCE family protein n=1 Tax=Nocardioides sp. TaxID=35761 RepID=UPI002C00B8CD|nr:MCE family protein [Nocardioides sp.]HTW17178.1 MCE family protein [Nocardioides sp.]